MRGIADPTFRLLALIEILRSGVGFDEHVTQSCLAADSLVVSLQEPLVTSIAQSTD